LVRYDVRVTDLDSSEDYFVAPLRLIERVS